MAGEMGVTGGGQYRVVTEDLLDFKQVDAVLDQMCGVAVAQAVRGDLFFRPQSAATWRKVFCTPPRSKGDEACTAPLRPP